MKRTTPQRIPRSHTRRALLAAFVLAMISAATAAAGANSDDINADMDDVLRDLDLELATT